MFTPLDKLYRITNIKSYVPLILDLDRLNYHAWREFFKNHCASYKVFGHLDAFDHKPTDQDSCTADSIVKQWLYGTLTQPLIQSILIPDATTTQLWKAIEDLFRDNKEANAIELENQLRNTTLGDSTNMEYYKCIKSITDLVANIGSKVPERTLVTYALNGLSSKFDHIATTIRHKTAFPTLLEIRSMLSIEEQTLHNQHNRIPQASYFDSCSSHQVLHTNHHSQSNNSGPFRGTQRGGGQNRGDGRGRNDRRGRGSYRNNGGGTFLSAAGALAHSFTGPKSKAASLAHSAASPTGLFFAGPQQQQPFNGQQA
ncbi:unnamed protein product [Lactuca saligna]|uniref:Retrotransposon Copia-like N-terminal domain-containing protein n=1 Tax=Lactuca saligna TaxID=75948 RepID=A0AA36E794_LACSI|nr:unnamed protein product [Lactuca saligna]